MFWKQVLCTQRIAQVVKLLALGSEVTGSNPTAAGILLWTQNEDKLPPARQTTQGGGATSLNPEVRGSISMSEWIVFYEVVAAELEVALPSITRLEPATSGDSALPLTPRAVCQHWRHFTQHISLWARFDEQILDSSLLSRDTAVNNNKVWCIIMFKMCGIIQTPLFCLKL